MKQPHLVNLFTAFVLIAAGIFSYFSNPLRPPTALIGVGLGAILLVMTGALKKNNKIVAHIVVVLTLIFGIMTASMALKSRNEQDLEKRNRRMLVFGVMSATCLVATGFYVAGFIDKRKQRLAGK